MTDAARLVELIRERQPCVVLTGAGISTETNFMHSYGVDALVAFMRDFEQKRG